MILTKEWLQQTIAAMESQRDEAPFGISDDHDMTLEALKMALAGMEADLKGNAAAATLESHGFTWAGGQFWKPPLGLPPAYVSNERAELENYRNAQQVVPGDVTGPLEYAYKELTPHFMRNHISVFERYGTLVDGLTGIQAMRIALDLMDRRAAMQSGAVKDGWVTCSDRMPDKIIPVLVMHADGEMWSAIWTGQKWDDGTEFPDPHCVTHWQEMPAAPQQEADNG